MLCFLLACALQVDRNVIVSSEVMSGSGVILETGLVLTNAHLLHGDVTVDDEPAEVVKIDKDHDLALLKVKTKKFKRVKFAEPKRGNPVYYVGNPSDHNHAVSRGHVVYVDEHHTVTDTLPIPGMSGGGLYDKKNRLIGLNTGFEISERVGVHLAVHVPIKVIRDFLRGS